MQIKTLLLLASLLAITSASAQIETTNSGSADAPAVFPKAIGGSAILRLSANKFDSSDPQFRLNQVSFAPYLITKQTERSANVLSTSLDFRTQQLGYSASADEFLDLHSFDLGVYLLQRRRIGAIERLSLHGEYGPGLSFGFSTREDEVRAPIGGFDIDPTFTYSVGAGFRAGLVVLYDLAPRVRVLSRYGSASTSLRVTSGDVPTFVLFDFDVDYYYQLNFGIEYQLRG